MIYQEKWENAKDSRAQRQARDLSWHYLTSLTWPQNFGTFDYTYTHYFTLPVKSQWVVIFPTDVIILIIDI